MQMNHNPAVTCSGSGKNDLSYSVLPQATLFVPLGVFVCSLVDITDELLDILMKLVYRLLCADELTLAKLLRSTVLGKHEHRRTKDIEAKDIAQPLSSLHISSKYVNFFHYLQLPAT